MPITENEGFIVTEQVPKLFKPKISPTEYDMINIKNKVIKIKGW